MNIRFVEWVFGLDLDPGMRGKVLVLNNKFLLSKGKWKGLMLSITGLGLSKLERKFFGTKFLEVRNPINLYFLKWVFTYDRNGYGNHLRAVKVIQDKLIFNPKLNTVRIKWYLHRLLNKDNAQCKEPYSYTCKEEPKTIAKPIDLDLLKETISKMTIEEMYSKSKYCVYQSGHG